MGSHFQETALTLSTLCRLFLSGKSLKIDFWFPHTSSTGRVMTSLPFSFCFFWQFQVLVPKALLVKTIWRSLTSHKQNQSLTINRTKLKLQTNLGIFLPTAIKGSSTFVMGFNRVFEAAASYSGRGCSLKKKKKGRNLESLRRCSKRELCMWAYPMVPLLDCLVHTQLVYLLPVEILTC